MCVTSNTAGAHAVDGLCESATALYATALREGRVARSDLVAAPCLVRRALVHPDPNDDRWMLPLPAPAALTRLLIPFAREVSDHLSDAAALLDTLLPFASLAPPPSDPTITVIHGNDRIMDSLREASRAARSEVLTAQPGGNRMVTNLRAGLENAQAVIEAGGRLRHLYQHPVRYSRRFAAYLDHLGPEHLEVRTMEQAIDRLIVFDRETAYLPAAPGTESALVIRHPALVAGWASASAPAAPTSPDSRRPSAPPAAPTSAPSSSARASSRTSPAGSDPMTAMSGPTVPEDGTSGTPPTGHGPEDGASGTPHPHHGPEELCAPARLLYTDALQRGGVTAAEADRVPCLTRLGLLRPDPHDPGRRLPVPAAAALTELLAPLTRDIHARVAASAALVEALAPLAPLTGSSDDPAMTVIQGKPAIQAAVAEAGKAARKRILTLHPGSKRPDVMLEQARQSAIEPLRRGVSMRHLYQHSARYNMNLKQYVDRLPQGDLQIRTMEQTAERMFVFDRSAYISISPERDVRRMGISVRTCRSHIARLTQTLGATSRTHLGALLIGSGIVEAHRRD